MHGKNDHHCFTCSREHGDPPASAELWQCQFLCTGLLLNCIYKARGDRWGDDDWVTLGHESPEGGQGVEGEHGPGQHRLHSLHTRHVGASTLSHYWSLSGFCSITWFVRLSIDAKLWNLYTDSLSSPDPRHCCMFRDGIRGLRQRGPCTCCSVCLAMKVNVWILYIL